MPLVAATHPPGVQHPLPVGGASVSKPKDSPEPVWESARHLGPPTSSCLRRSLGLSLWHSEAALGATTGLDVTGRGKATYHPGGPILAASRVGKGHSGGS